MARWITFGITTKEPAQIAKEYHGGFSGTSYMIWQPDPIPHYPMRFWTGLREHIKKTPDIHGVLSGKGIDGYPFWIFYIVLGAKPEPFVFEEQKLLEGPK
jgi:hypothetical protein